MYTEHHEDDGIVKTGKTKKQLRAIKWNRRMEERSNNMSGGGSIATESVSSNAAGDGYPGVPPEALSAPRAMRKDGGHPSNKRRAERRIAVGAEAREKSMVDNLQEFLRHEVKEKENERQKEMSSQQLWNQSRKMINSVSAYKNDEAEKEREMLLGERTRENEPVVSNPFGTEYKSPLQKPSPFFPGGKYGHSNTKDDHIIRIFVADQESRKGSEAAVNRRADGRMHPQNNEIGAVNRMMEHHPGIHETAPQAAAPSHLAPVRISTDLPIGSALIRAANWAALHRWQQRDLQTREELKNKLDCEYEILSNATFEGSRFEKEGWEYGRWSLMQKRLKDGMKMRHARERLALEQSQSASQRAYNDHAGGGFVDVDGSGSVLNVESFSGGPANGWSTARKDEAGGVLAKLKREAKLTARCHGIISSNTHQQEDDPQTLDRAPVSGEDLRARHRREMLALDPGIFDGSLAFKKDLFMKQNKARHREEWNAQDFQEDVSSRSLSIRPAAALHDAASDNAPVLSTLSWTMGNADGSEVQRWTVVPKYPLELADASKEEIQSRHRAEILALCPDASTKGRIESHHLADVLAARARHRVELQAVEDREKAAESRRRYWEEMQSSAGTEVDDKSASMKRKMRDLRVDQSRKQRRIDASLGVDAMMVALDTQAAPRNREDQQVTVSGSPSKSLGDAEDVENASLSENVRKGGFVGFLSRLRQGFAAQTGESGQSTRGGPGQKHTEDGTDAQAHSPAEAGGLSSVSMVDASDAHISGRSKHDGEVFASEVGEIGPGEWIGDSLLELLSKVGRSNTATRSANDGVHPSS